MANTKVYHDALNGLQLKYERGFKPLAEAGLNIEEPLKLTYDSRDKQNRSNLYRYMRTNFNNFQEPYVANGFELGKAIYSSTRDYQEGLLNTTFRPLEEISLTKTLLNKNVVPFWTMTGLIEKVYNGEFSLDLIASIGSQGVADLARNSTVAASEADTYTVKVQKIKLSPGACDFCQDIARYQDDDWTGAGFDKGKDIKMHKNCNCSVSYEFSSIPVDNFNRLSRSQQRRITKTIYNQNNA